ncbi:hypothetical protein J2W17_005861 [Pseudomonas lini]|nr:hypothetical protein [Pseudomonas lini]
MCDIRLGVSIMCTFSGFFSDEWSVYPMGCHETDAVSVVNLSRSACSKHADPCAMPWVSDKRHDAKVPSSAREKFRLSNNIDIPYWYLK